MAEQLGLDFLTPRSELSQLWTPDDVFLNATQSIVEAFKEDRRVERKSARIQAKDLGDYLSMYANTQPHGGVVFIGIEKDGEITGCSRVSTEHINKLETVNRYCSDARHEFKRIEVRNSAGKRDFVILLRVHFREDRLVETSDGEAYVREGDEKRRLSETEKREIRIAKGEIDYELEDVGLIYPNQFDTALINQFVKSFAAKRGIRSGFEIEDIRYEGREESFGRNLNSTIDERIEGPLPNQIVAVEKFVSRT